MRKYKPMHKSTDFRSYIKNIEKMIEDGQGTVN